VERGEVTYGFIPVENTIAGTVVENYDLLFANDIFVIGEAYLPIRHTLLAKKGARLEDIKEKLEMALSAMNQTAERLISRLEVNDGAEIQVFGTVFPDTYVEICNVGLTVSQKLSSVRFRLDKPSGKINVEPLCVRQS